MPIHEYKCKHCNHTCEKFFKTFASAEQAVKCDNCGKAMSRLLSACFGWDATANPSEYEYTHQVRPKYITDTKGRRQKFNPNTMGKGRKGSR